MALNKSIWHPQPRVTNIKGTNLKPSKLAGHSVHNNNVQVLMHWMQTSYWLSVENKGEKMCVYIYMYVYYKDYIPH